MVGLYIFLHRSPLQIHCSALRSVGAWAYKGIDILLFLLLLLHLCTIPYFTRRIVLLTLLLYYIAPDLDESGNAPELRSV